MTSPNQPVAPPVAQPALAPGSVPQVPNIPASAAPPQYTRLDEQYEAPLPELITKLNELKNSNTITDAEVKTSVDQALRLAPTVSVPEVVSNEMRSRANKFLQFIEKIDTYLDKLPSSPARTADLLLVRSEAVRLQRALSAGTPLLAQADLARLLRNLCKILRQVGGRDAESCDAGKEALRIERECYRVRPGARRAPLATTLNTYSLSLAAAGNREAEALETSEEAVALRRVLYAFDEDKYREPLAYSLKDLGARLSAVQRFAEGKTAEEEALALWRTLYATNPRRYRPQLVQCLTKYVGLLKDLGLAQEFKAAQAERDELRAQIAQN